MPLYIKDDTIARLVAKFAKLRGLSKQDAVKLAVPGGIAPRQRSRATARPICSLAPSPSAAAGHRQLRR